MLTHTQKAYPLLSMSNKALQNKERVYMNKTSEAWKSVLSSREAKIERLISALKLIAGSDNFRDGTDIKELQSIARNVLKQETPL